MSEKSETDKKAADLEEYRKKKSGKKHLIRLMIIAVIFFGVLAIAVNMDNILEPIRSMVSKIETKTSDEVGFPIKLSGSASYSFKSFGENFSLLTDTYLYTYNMDGGQNYALRHSYSKPVQYTNSKRILIYDKDYNDFSVYNKTRMIYKGSVKEKIIFGTLSNNESTAIVTNSDRYSNVIYIFDGSGNNVYSRKIPYENIMSIAFSYEDKYIYAAAMGVENGEIYSKIYKYDITSDKQEAVWEYKAAKSSIPLKIFARKGRICTIYDNYCLSLNESDGSMTGEKEFNGTIQCFDFSDSIIGLIYLDPSSNKKILVSMGYDMSVKASGTVTPNINRIITDGNSMYIIQSGKITGYNSEIKVTSEKQLEDDYVSFIKIKGSFLLLGYNSVDIVNLQ